MPAPANDLYQELLRSLSKLDLPEKKGLLHDLKSMIAAEEPPNIRHTSGVVGGKACIRQTRIPVWLIVDLKRQGVVDSEILEGYPSLSMQDIEAALHYYADHRAEIEGDINEHYEEE